MAKNNQEDGNLTKNEIEAKVAVIETALATLQTQVTKLTEELKKNAETRKLDIKMTEELIQQEDDKRVMLKDAVFKRIIALEKKVFKK